MANISIPPHHRNSDDTTNVRKPRKPHTNGHATEQRPPAFSDEALALSFADRHSADTRYVAKWGRWKLWTGNVWKPDTTLRTFDMSRAICREAAIDAAARNIRAAPGIASAATVAAVERLARSDRRIAAEFDQWDVDPWLINTPDGVVDLRTGSVRLAAPTDYMTKMTAVAPGGDCPIWLKFLDRVTASDAELMKYLQRLFGYSLTGITREHSLAFLFGLGANGKSVLLSTVAGVLGDYHTTAPIETFTVSKGDRHPTDLAGLMGARLVTASETEQGHQWAEAKIKNITGGEKITARFMRGDFFEYVPQFKLVIAGNHKPRLSTVDEAIRRRLHFVPFTVTIPPNERDAKLAQKLKAEWPGILRWMIDGCVHWQRIGLSPPAIIRQATDEYLTNEDAMAAWITECCERDASTFTSASDLFNSWTAWAGRNGEVPLTMRKFSERLETCPGVKSHRTKNARGFIGLRVIRAG